MPTPSDYELAEATFQTISDNAYAAENRGDVDEAAQIWATAHDISVSPAYFTSLSDLYCGFMFERAHRRLIGDTLPPDAIRETAGQSAYRDRARALYERAASVGTEQAAIALDAYMELGRMAIEDGDKKTAQRFVRLVALLMPSAITDLVRTNRELELLAGRIERYDSPAKGIT